MGRITHLLPRLMPFYAGCISPPPIFLPAVSFSENYFHPFIHLKDLVRHHPQNKLIFPHSVETEMQNKIFFIG